HHRGHDTQDHPNGQVIGGHGPDDGNDHDGVSDFGIKPRVEGPIECQSNVAMATKIITATRAAMGIIATISPSVTDRIRISTPAVKVEIRVRAWEAFTLIMVWPTIAQPP